MVLLPAARFRAGIARGAFAAGTAALGALAIGASGAAHAETASDVLKKMADVYTKAKTYQVSVMTQQSGKTPDGKTFTVTQSERIQYESPNKFHKTVKLSGTGAAAAGAGAQQLALRQGEIVSDGKIATMYVPSRKMYQKQPVPAQVGINQLVDLLRLVPPINRPGLTLLPNSATVQGRPAYVIEIKPVAPPGLKGADMKRYQDSIKQFRQFPHFMIDKQNYNLLGYSLVTTSGTAQVNLISQTFGGSVPSGAFVFTPPAGTKQFVPPKPPPGAPGVPGVPGGVPGGAPGGIPK